MCRLWIHFMLHSLRISIKSHHSEHGERDEFQSTAQSSHLCCLMSAAVTSQQTSFARLAKEASFLTWLPVPFPGSSDRIQSTLSVSRCSIQTQVQRGFSLAPLWRMSDWLCFFLGKNPHSFGLADTSACHTTQHFRQQIALWGCGIANLDENYE